MSSRARQAAVAAVLTVAAAATIALAGQFYDGLDRNRQDGQDGSTQTKNPADTTWPSPAPTAVAGLIAALGEINPELRYGSPELKAMLICRDIKHGDSDERVTSHALEIFSGGGSFSLTNDQGAHIVSAVRENICTGNQS
ncbi:hypothetical protein ACFP3U_08955 [Kitasatospora misakiensis]|uniref:DUF732 domain-containing protein n=1 Tax=Kitasatospora misakiensis TaxID=67330 RepID=A0ABW0X007_9ACTN